MRNKEDIYPSHFWFCAVKDMKRKSLPGRTDETPVLEPPDAKNWLISEDPDAGKDWRQEEKGTTEDEMVDGTTNSKRKRNRRKWKKVAVGQKHTPIFLLLLLLFIKKHLMKVKEESEKPGLKLNFKKN